QLEVSRDEMGARGLERGDGLRASPVRHWHEDHRARGMKTDFFTRSFDVARHAEYDVLVDRVMSAITDPKQMERYSTPEQIADVVYEAATDGKDQLRYLAGADAKATYAMRLEIGDQAFHKAIAQQFFGLPAQA